VGTRNFFFESATAIPQLEGSTSATFKEMLLRNRNSAIAIFLKSTTHKSATWELHFRNFRHIFGHGIGFIHKQKIGGKISRATVPLRQVLFPEKQTILKIILVYF
jgi:hypothetical protein